ncbi:hypothetical protein H8F21_13925 [Pseudomonas sp. P66]|uniref:Uncharacterized protein n=1 Tax=Pseudomonas arcuscaelestis TaxID=2710591 RepID=A0ABS2BYI2_9PSED|nr:hypothetical protein [Pseudomonas arcuscaelestis]MBM5458664.1 hypothetical protein [Pseudomonas arcuscaelestis]
MPKYLSGNWSHIFDGEEHERMTRIVVDAETKKLVFAQVQRIRSMSTSYSEAHPAEMKDLEDSILNANCEVFDDPADYGLTGTEAMPGWAENLA